VIGITESPSLSITNGYSFVPWFEPRYLTTRESSGKQPRGCIRSRQGCKRGERCLFLSYEESSGQLIQNMSSIGLYLEPSIKKGLLKIVSLRPSFFGLEMHLLDLYKIIADFKPKSVVIDPLTSLIGQGDQLEIQSMLTRMNISSTMLSHKSISRHGTTATSAWFLMPSSRSVTG
jgi:circadian clock protein KaiC